MKKITFLTIALLLIILTGCSEKENEAAIIDGPSEEAIAMLSNKAKEIGVELPSFVLERSELVQENYALSYEYGEDVLKSMPCFCGCVNQGHESNFNCFIKEKKGTEVVWDKMGLNCDICNGIARESIALYEEGNSLYEIRTFIDKKYGDYGPSTKTPMPDKSI